MARTAAILALAALALSAHAMTFIDCACSPSSRGFSASAVEELRDARRSVQELAAALRRDMRGDASVTRVSIARRVRTEMFRKWEHCLGNFSPEECVNADAALRRGRCYPNCDSFCRYNPTTWANIAGGGAPRNSCDKFPGLRSQEQALIDGTAENKPALRPSPSPRPPAPAAPKPPAPAAAQPPKPAPAPAPGQAPPGQAPPAQAAPANDPPAQDSSAEAPPADNPQDTAAQDAAQDAAKEIPVRRTPTPGASGSEPEASPEGGDLFGEPAASRWEGCVAVEHLHGYVLQHRADLWRPVLCAHGFCATANHAIIVGGRLTSMRRLCAREWRCVRSERWVNNLKLAANRRAVVSDRVTVTPYDLRFPKAAVWAVQIAEDVLALVGTAVVAAALAFATLSVHARVSA